MIKNVTEIAQWNEHIRKRPGMYVGSVNVKGFIDTLKFLLSESIAYLNCNALVFEFKREYAVKLIFKNISNPIRDDWAILVAHDSSNQLSQIYAQSLNALSSRFNINYLDESEQSIRQQEFQEGILKKGKIEHKEIHCNSLEIDFTLDLSIWKKENFSWNENFLLHEIQEFAYLHRHIRFHLNYTVAGEACHVIYHFKSGLKDRIQLETLKTYGGGYMETHIDQSIANFSIEIAFAFIDYSVDGPFLKSYANDFRTTEHGVHVDGLLQGITFGVMKYFQKHQLTQSYKISEKGIQENLIAAINIRLDNPLYSGCVRNKLATPEISEAIAKVVAEVVFEKIDGDEELCGRLIREFEI